MNRRILLDILVPLAYILGIAVAVLIGNATGVAMFVLFGAVIVLGYFASARKNIRQDRYDTSAPTDPAMPPSMPTGTTPGQRAWGANTPPSQTAWSPTTQPWGGASGVDGSGSP